MIGEMVKALEEFKKYTIELIKCLEKEDYDSLEDFLNKRQEILDELSNLEYIKEEISKVSEDLEVLTYNKKLSDLMIEERDKVKQEINRLSKGRDASNAYNKQGYGPRVFSKKI